MYKKKKTYIKELVDNIVSVEFPDWELCSPLIRKTGNKNKHKILLARLLEDIMLENKYLHKSGLPFHYSFSKKELLDKIFRDRKNEVDKNDPLKRSYGETDPRNEEGIKRLFDIVYTQSRTKKITNTYILKPWYRPSFMIGKSINSITYYSDSGLPQDIPKYTLPKNVRDYVGSDISNKIYVNIEAIGIANREINKIIEITESLSYKKRKLTLKLLNDFLIKDLRDSKEIKNYDLAIKRLEEHSNSLKAISIYSSSNDYINPCIYHQYKEETSNSSGNGRLWNSIDVSNIFNIQTMSKVVRNIILTDIGYVEYDINNCHINILSQYYKMVFGKNNDSIEYFCNNYKKVRYDIVNESNVSYKLVKEAMLSITYGGTYLTPNQIKNLDVRTLDKIDIWNKFKEYYTTEDKSRIKIYNLYNSPSFIKFSETIKEITKELDEQSKKGIGVYGDYINGYINPCGKVLDDRNSSKSNYKLSHLFQGIEAAALKTIIKDDPESIVSLHHDGWIGRTKRYRGSNDEITIYLQHLKERVYRETKRIMIAWNNKIGKPLIHPDGFNFDFSYQRLEGMDNINCKANTHTVNTLISGK